MLSFQKVIGVVILFQPQNNVIDHINSYLPYLKLLYIIDNSKIQNKTLIEQINLLDKCQYLFNNGNYGISKPLNLAADNAIKKDAAWLLTMDQDSYFKSNDFYKLITFAQKQDYTKTAIVSALQSSYLDEYNIEKLTDEPFTIITSGNLINLSLYEKIGEFNENYFIDGIDTEYALRVHQKNYTIKRLNNIILCHQLGNTTNHQGCIVRNHSPLRRFYMTRNALDLIAQSYKSHPRFALSTAKSIIINFKNILFYENQKKAKIVFMIKGLLAYITSQWGKFEKS